MGPFPQRQHLEDGTGVTRAVGEEEGSEDSSGPCGHQSTWGCDPHDGGPAGTTSQIPVQKSTVLGNVWDHQAPSLLVEDSSLKDSQTA